MFAENAPFLRSMSEPGMSIAPSSESQFSLATVLQQGMGLTLSHEKTHITPLTDGFEFLGHRVRMRGDTLFGWTPCIEVQQKKVDDLRYKVKQLTGQATRSSISGSGLQKLNPILCGRANFYRHCTGAKDILSNFDWHVGDRLCDECERSTRTPTYARCYATAVPVISDARVRTALTQTKAANSPAWMPGC